MQPANISSPRKNSFLFVEEVKITLHSVIFHAPILNDLDDKHQSQVQHAVFSVFACPYIIQMLFFRFECYVLHEWHIIRGYLCWIISDIIVDNPW